MNDVVCTGEFKPRVIVWQLTPFDGPVIRGKGNGAEGAELQGPLSQHEALLTIDSIARLSKSIVVLTGPKLTRRTDLHDIVQYGFALGLKMIIELSPEDVTLDVIKRFRRYGPRIFRLIIDGRIIEDMNTRYKRTPDFQRLEKAVLRLKDAGFELHFSLDVTQPNERKLGFNLDYAFHRGAKGLYCHLNFDDTVALKRALRRTPQSVDDFIRKISELKSLLPDRMYFSPQCVKFRHAEPDEGTEIDLESDSTPVWIHLCLAGKSFAVIGVDGKVYPCRGSRVECGDLRASGYDFGRMWKTSTTFNDLRKHQWSCHQTREHLRGADAPSNGENERVDQPLKEMQP